MYSRCRAGCHDPPLASHANQSGCSLAIDSKFSQDDSCENLLSMARLQPDWLAWLASGGSWQPARHLEYIARHLVDVAAGKIRRLVILCPPRHGKSVLVSQYFPAW